MRLRNISGSREIIADSKYVIQDAENQKGKIRTYFEKDQPIQIEIGMGKGRFIMQMAEEHPEINFIGIEKYSSVLVRAIEKQTEAILPNLVFIRMDAETIENVFAPGEVDYIYLNFSDPWPKDRHAKRRLPSKEFLARYNEFLLAFISLGPAIENPWQGGPPTSTSNLMSLSSKYFTITSIFS